MRTVSGRRIIAPQTRARPSRKRRQLQPPVLGRDEASHRPSGDGCQSLRRSRGRLRKVSTLASPLGASTCINSSAARPQLLGITNS